MNRVIHFEIHAADPQAAIKFYETVFDWKFHQWAGQEYWLISTGPEKEPGINGGLIKRRGEIDGNAVIAFVCTIDVADIDQKIKLATQAGGQRVLEKSAVPGVGWLVYFKDVAGNIFGMMQNDPAAK